MVQAGASDLHLCVGSPPIIRKDGSMQALDPAAGVLGTQDLVQLLAPIMQEMNRKEFTERHDKDFAYEITELARLRSYAFVVRRGQSAALRRIQAKSLTAEQI